MSSTTLYSTTDMAVIDSFETVFGDKQKVMVVSAHPDDAEILAGGLILRLLQSGKEVRVVKMTSGGKGSGNTEISEEDLKKQRELEDQQSMQILGVTEENNVYLDLGDGQVEDTQSAIAKVVFQIRQFKPDIVITHNPENVVIRFDKNENWINHRDHRNSALVVVNAVYPYSRDLSFFPEQFEDFSIASHKVNFFLFSESYNHPDEFFFDVTDQFEQKVRALCCHKSQMDQDRSRDLCEFMCLKDGDKFYERFRFVPID